MQTTPGPRKNKLIPAIKDLLLLVLSSLLYALAFPNYLFSWGFFPLAFFALIPVFYVIRRSGWLRVILYGIFFGILSNLVFNFWLAAYNPLAIIIVLIIYSFYFLSLFLFLKLADFLFKEHGYILQAFTWVAYEYLKTLGFLGYSYGNLAYSQYLFLPFIQLASVTGTWGVSLLVVFPSALLASALAGGFARFLPRLRQRLPSVITYLAVFLIVILFGSINMTEYNKARRWPVGLVQPDMDPWLADQRQQEDYLKLCINLSNQALSSQLRPRIIIWPETAFVPPIQYHNKYRFNQDKFRQVHSLFAYLDTQSIPFLIGNDHRELTGEQTVDYNAALLMDKRNIIAIYRKIHLVPFAEHFPYGDIFPGFYQWLQNSDTHFWQKGKEYTVFHLDNVNFSTPICFEDTFGYICREFVNNGAQVLVNLTNDSWANSVVAQMQHMGMSVLRAAENRRPVARCAADGITCLIDPDGRIIDMAMPDTAAYLVGSIPIIDNQKTVYTRVGDIFAILILLGVLAGIIFGIAYKLYNRYAKIAES